MGFFDKKYCDICGEKIGLLGNRKLEDGNLCKDCAAKLSPFFSERRRSTVEQIREQLAYREENQEAVRHFNVTRTLGHNWKVLIDEDAKKFMVTRARKLEEANPDVIDLSAVTGVQIDIDEDRDEEKRKDKDGKMVSYYPPRYQYSYDFDIIINVNHPYFDEIRFQLNDSRVRTGNRSINDNSARPMGFGGARPQNNAMNMANLIGAALGSAINAAASGAGSNEPWNAEYRQYLYEAEEIRDLLLQTRNEIREEKAAASAPRAKVVCPACGATTMPDANGCCEYCGCSVV